MDAPSHFDLCRLAKESYGDIPNARKIGSVGAVAWVVPIPQGQVLVFRGTFDALGFLVDCNLRKRADAWGKVHRGFADAWAELRGGVGRALGRGDVWVCGHSLGAALALLAAADIAARNSAQVREVVTFGGPRVGDHDWTTSYAKVYQSRTTRYVHGLDPVPWLPLWPGYRHPCGFKWSWDRGYWNGGLGRVGLALLVGRLLHDHWRLWSDGERFEEIVGSALAQGRGDHAIGNYLSCFHGDK